MDLSLLLFLTKRRNHIEGQSVQDLHQFKLIHWASLSKLKRSHNRSNNIILHLLQLSKLQQQQQRQMKHSAKLAHHLKQMCLDSLQSQTAYHRLYHQETLAFPVSPTLLLILQDKILTQILISLTSLLIHSQTIITIHNIISQELNHLNQLIEIKAPHQPLTNAVLHHLCHSLLQSLKNQRRNKSKLLSEHQLHKFHFMNFFKNKMIKKFIF